MSRHGAGASSSQDTSWVGSAAIVLAKAGVVLMPAVLGTMLARAIGPVFGHLVELAFLTLSVVLFAKVIGLELDPRGDTGESGLAPRQRTPRIREQPTPAPPER